MELEEKIQNNADKLEELTVKIEKNISKINENSERIQHNTGALSLLHTIKTTSDKFFVMWLITFIAFLGSVAYIIFCR